MLCGLHSVRLGGGDAIAGVEAPSLRLLASAAGRPPHAGQYTRFLGLMYSISFDIV